ncbi:hypothetical protein C4Q31_03500 [Leptospira borgpetersenii serovar Ceylonica]|uniref:Uncharacterized protein n=4 Tax=Leptospira borgpetersenii TaxID=174 RepID=M3GAF8_LEPBO|nr:hypothetical protein C4Q31_03500 [Leptospira borgpetersenii serovar Ceylonica]EKR00125.1 hypothetical protein LEP1GSC121_3736 [Leptospira borgpetersenii serovar Castellonis str. 200801910]EMF97891.1 hypothetical protein LEP1GSC123_4098 [Leptospira borgpetersenii str. 200701203]EMO09945.1 hypothetical protein LEP1GSC137_3367 [Leptospira borgpetersenii str. Noumea 25]KGE21930.1 hypothetical protein IQ66_19390 [Leptospira borgpetersenii serovar Ballum]QHE27071.1 hypothetical protein GS524_0877
MTKIFEYENYSLYILCDSFFDRKYNLNKVQITGRFPNGKIQCQRLFRNSDSYRGGYCGF